MSVNDKIKLMLYLWLLSVAFLGGLLLKSPAQMVTLDAKKIVSDIMLNDVSKGDQIRSIDEMSQCLSQIIDEYAIQHKVMILPKQAVIAGNRDITREIHVRMYQKCGFRSKD